MHRDWIWNLPRLAPGSNSLLVALPFSNTRQRRHVFHQHTGFNIPVFSVVASVQPLHSPWHVVSVESPTHPNLHKSLSTITPDSSYHQHGALQGRSDASQQCTYCKDVKWRSSHYSSCSTWTTRDAFRNKVYRSRKGEGSGRQVCLITACNTCQLQPRVGRYQQA